MLINFRERGREGERERDINQLPLICTPSRTEPAAQACALTGNRTHDLSTGRLSNQLSHISQGKIISL